MEKIFKFKIKSNLEDICKQYLEIVKCLPPYNGLTNKERDVFAELLYQYMILPDMAAEYKFKILFDYDTKLQMRERLGVTDATFKNNLSSLRCKGLITSDNKVHKQYLFTPGKDGLSVQFDLLLV
jgi:DNA-binding MarR family transcriptional regulator